MAAAKSWDHNNKAVSMKEIHVMPCKHKRTLGRKRDQLASGMTVQEVLDYIPMSPQESQRRAAAKSPWRHDRICRGSHTFEQGISNE